MKAVKFLPYVLVVGLLLAPAGSVGLGLAQGPEPPEGEVQPRGDLSIEAAVSSKFSYQGVLKENGSPVTGSRDMTFRLYSDDTCSTQVGSDIVESGVQVTDGLFSVELDVTHSHFNGQGLWLEVEVGGTKIGCQEILPVPYALSLKPGAQVIGEQTNGNAIYAYNTASTGGTTYGVYGRTDSGAFGASGVFGEAITGSAYGVHGRADGSNSFASGVFGEATGSSNQAYGVRGTSASTSGYGVYGHATAATGTTYGVFGQTTSSSGAAIYGQGDVKQNRAGNGLVKAAVYVDCNDDWLLGVVRAFNNVTSDAIVPSPGPSNGRCTIDFGFDISDRYWVAMAVGQTDYGVTCQLGSSNDQLNCGRWQAGGVDTDGYIMVLVY